MPSTEYLLDRIRRVLSERLAPAAEYVGRRPSPPGFFPVLQTGPPTDWGELVQAHDNREAIQASADELPAIDIDSL